MAELSDMADLLIVGAGAAGLATAIFAARAAPSLRVACVDGARRIGAKILVSGGSRCNVTNARVGEHDFWGGSPRVVRHVLRAWPAARAVTFFAEIGVALHEEEDGKLFPDSNSAKTVLAALLAEASRLRIDVIAGTRVSAIARATDGFVVLTDRGEWRAPRVVLATGGRSLPKTGSDGAGYALAASLGHGLIETTPALAPMVLGGAWHTPLSGVAHACELAIRIDGRVATRLSAPLLWTHFGASGPLILNASRHWHRARLDGRDVALLLSSLPGETFASVEAWLVEQARARPRASVMTVLATRVPGAVATAFVEAAGIDHGAQLSQLSREERRAVVRLLVELPLRVTDSRGYNFAEVTAGGVPLDEIDAATMESRCCRGLHLVGEVLDVDGRLGGFNFQWAWSSGFVAGTAAARLLASARRDAP